MLDACVCVAVLWLAYVLSDRRLFRSLGKPAMLAAGALLCVPVLWLGGLFSLITSLVVVPWLAMEAYNDTEQPLPRASRRLLTAARIVVFILVILCLLRPRLGFEDVTIQRACAVVLADVSRSMDYPPEPKTSRYERLKAVLEDHADTIEEIKEVCDYRLATFGKDKRYPV